MWAGLQGAPNESVLEYVPFGATPKTGAKTSKTGDLFLSAGLNSAGSVPDALNGIVFKVEPCNSGKLCKFFHNLPLIWDIIFHKPHPYVFHVIVFID